MLVLEKRPYLGGRAYSFLDKATATEVDNGQHIFMKCCTYYVDFLGKLGCYEKTRVQDRLSVRVVDQRGRASTLSSSVLPAPIHLGPSLLRYRHLSAREKLAVARAGAALRRISERDLAKLDGVSFSDWLKCQRQTDRVIERFWDLIILPALNDSSRDVSAAQAIMILQTGLTGDRHAADIGVSRVGLSRLLADEAHRYIEARGGRVLLSHGIACLEGTAEAIEGVHTHGGQFLKGDAYIMAVPSNELGGLLPKGLREDEFFRRAAGLRMSPIVNLHLWLDRRVMDAPFATYLGSRIQWVFNKSIGDETRAASRGADPGQRLVISISGAHRYIDMPKQPLYDLLLEDLHRRIPLSQEARVLHHVLVRERFATFSPAPGSAAHRLPQRTPVSNLFLAGAWTATGWPATMESAVRSGIFCARAIAGERDPRKDAA